MERKDAKELSSKIIIPIYEYLRTCDLDSEIAFVYRGRISDVDILAPKFDFGVEERAADINTIIDLLIKNGMSVPEEILLHRRNLQRIIVLKKSIRDFENWLVGHIMYLDFGSLILESVYYTPQSGFLVKFEGLKSLIEGFPKTSIALYDPDVLNHDLLNSKKAGKPRRAKRKTDKNKK